MNCKKCGCPLNENDQFCKNCGEIVNYQTNNVGIESSINVNNNRMNQQPMYNQPQTSQQPKKKNTALTVSLSIAGIFILGLVALFMLFNISENKERVWSSGQVQIMGKTIQLPCNISTFESTLNTKIKSDDIYDGIVEINTITDSKLMFKVYINNNMVTGIMMDIYPSDADEYDRIMPANERHIANKIIFPGNVTSDTNIEEVKNLYKTTPFNVYYNHFSETIEEMDDEHDGWISSNYDYHDNEWQIIVHTKTNIRTNIEEITEIDYWYLGE